MPTIQILAKAAKKNIGEEIIRETAGVLDPDDVGTLLTALSSNGSEPATYYIGGWDMPAGQFTSFRAKRTAKINAGDIDADDVIYFNNPDYRQVIDALGLQKVHLPPFS